MEVEGRPLTRGGRRGRREEERDAEDSSDSERGGCLGPTDNVVDDDGMVLPGAIVRLDAGSTRSVSLTTISVVESVGDNDDMDGRSIVKSGGGK